MEGEFGFIQISHYLIRKINPIMLSPIISPRGDTL